MKYDDASWHYAGDFPADLPSEAGATHMAMFVIWAWRRGLAGELQVEEFPEEIELARKRALTPAALFIRACDEKFTDGDLNHDGNAFAQHYYGSEGQLVNGPGSYIEDYSSLCDSLPSSYHLPDSWETFDRLAPIIDRRFEEWRGKQMRRTR